MARKAKGTDQLLKQINELVPNRNKTSDGWIGDAAHQATKSDHNPNKKSVVRALDITHDPRNGMDTYKLAEVFKALRDPRMKYQISNRKIMSGPAGPKPWEWRAYTGKNPHDLHWHLSLGRDVEDGSDAKFYDDASPFDLSAYAAIPDKQAPAITLPLVKMGDKGLAVEILQLLLGKTGKEIDGDFGKRTYDGVRQFQRDHGLDDDGKVGQYTWRELMRPWAREVGLLPKDPEATLNKMAAAALELASRGADVKQVYNAFLIILADIIPPGTKLPALPEAPSLPPTDEASPEPPPSPPEEVEPPAPLPDDDIKHFHSVVKGGFYSSDPDDLDVPTSIRTNNPGALNTTKYIATLPGYKGAQDYAGKGNNTAIFWAPEYGVLAYWDLLRRYREAGATTIRAIITKYGGGQDYSEYVTFVTKTTGLPSTYQVKIDGSDDANLVKFAKAMWRYEAGRNTPLTDPQIRAGFGLGREHARMT